MKRALLFALAIPAAAQAYTGLQTKLSSTDAAETVEAAGGTYINVLGTGDAKPGNEWEWSKDVVYDGKVHMSDNAWFEPSWANGESTGAWAGFKTTAAASVTKIRYYARNDGSEYAERAIGLKFQAASDEDFTDAIDIYTIPSMSLDDLTNGWQEVYISPTTAKYSYFRILGDYGGNLCEAEFYGTTADLTASAAPSAPSFTTFAVINGKFTYGFTAAAEAHSYRVERRYAGDAEWETLAAHEYIDEGTAISATLDCYLPGPAEYRLVAVNAAGETAGAVQEVGYYKPLKGTVIAADGETALASHPAGDAFDGSPSTYYKSTTAGLWVGLDLGAAKSVAGVRVMPQQGGDRWYTEHDYVEVSDDAVFSAATASGSLYKSWSEMDAGVVSNHTFAAMNGRYVRYFSSSDKDGRHCCPAELEFLSNDYTPEEAPRNLAVAGAQLTWALPDIACMTARVVRTTAPGGGSDTVVTDLRGDISSWTDTTAKAGVTYYYTVAFVNNIGGVEYVGAHSPQVSCRFIMQIERDENDQTQLRTGMTAYDSDNNGTTAMFDGSVEWDSWPDLSAEVKVGVNLDGDYVVESFRVYPRTDSYGLSRCNGMVLATDARVVSEPCVISTEEGSAQWYEFATMERTAASRFFLERTDEQGFHGNVAELQLFGYKASDAAGVLLAPISATAAWKRWRITLDWEDCQNAASYNVERAVDGGEWTTVATGLAASEWTDENVSWGKADYAYRITSVASNGGRAVSNALVPTGTGARRGTFIIIR